MTEIPNTPKTAKTPGMMDVKKYFGIERAGDFKREWDRLSEEDREQFKRGILDGTLNY